MRRIRSLGWLVAVSACLVGAAGCGRGKPAPAGLEVGAMKVPEASKRMDARARPTPPPLGRQYVAGPTRTPADGSVRR